MSTQDLPGGSDSKESASNVGEPRFSPWVGTFPWRKPWQPTPVFFPGEFCGQRSLAGYSPQVWKESDTTERLTLKRTQHLLVFCIFCIFCICCIFWGFSGGISGKEPACQCRRCKRCGYSSWVGKIPWRKHGNPLWYSCLENPMDRGAWQATYSPWGHTESDMTEMTSHARMHVTQSVSLISI